MGPELSHGWRQSPTALAVESSDFPARLHSASPG